MTTTEFAEAKLYIKEHKQAECGFSSFKDLLNAATSSFSVVVDPNIVNAYVQCLKLKHDAGISYTFEYGTDRNDFSATLKYVQRELGLCKVLVCDPVFDCAYAAHRQPWIAPLQLREDPVRRQRWQASP